MQKHIVLKIIDDLGIKSAGDISPSLNAINPEDAVTILNQMDTWYLSQFATLREPKQVSAFGSIWIPATLDKSLQQITSDLILTDAVFLSDPLYDYLSAFEGGFFSSENIELTNEILKVKPDHFCHQCQKEIETIIQNETRNNLKNVFQFYLQAKDLIQEGYIIPYVDTSSRPRTSLEGIMNIFKKSDKDIANLVAYEKINKERLHQAIAGERHAVTEKSLPFIKNSAGILAEKTRMAVGLDELINTQYSLSENVDFLGGLSDNILRRSIKLISKSLSDKGVKDGLPFTTDLVSLPTLSGMPIETVPEILVKEREALEQLRASLASKVLSISAPYGSTEWKKELDHIKLQVELDIIQLKRVLSNIKKTYLKKQAGNVTLVGFSVGLASLALLNQSFDTITAIQTIVGGAGLSAGLKSIFDTWVNYQERIQDQKLKDAYYIWKLKSKKRAL